MRPAPSTRDCCSARCVPRAAPWLRCAGSAGRGVLALADKVQGRSATLLVGAVAVIGLAALLSFTATGQIVDARMGGKPVKARDLSRSAAPVLLFVGLGMFVYLFTGSLKL